MPTERPLKRIMNLPASPNSMAQPDIWQPEFPRPFGQCLAASFVVEDDVCSRVVGLDAFDCPPAIPRLIAASVVNAVDGMVPGWGVPHVSQEIVKGLGPPLANANSSRAVVLEVGAVWIAAASLHAAPSGVDLRSGKAVGSCRISQSGRSHAPATRPVPPEQVRNRGRRFDAAVADTPPHRVLSSRHEFQGDQAPKPTPFDAVQNLGHVPKSSSLQ